MSAVLADGVDGAVSADAASAAHQLAAEPQGARKQFATLQARAALAGVVLLEMQTDCGRTEFLATKWHLTRGFSSLNELDVWLDRIGAPR